MIDNSEITNYRVYPIRWVHLLVYVLANFANAMNSITFAPIESETSQFFGITTTQVNVLAVVFLFLYVVGTMLTIWIYRLLSLRMGLIVGTILNLGVFIRLFALISPTNGYPALVIGQIIPAIAQPFFLNITALFAARWFAVKQRDIATAIGSMANPLGIIQNEQEKI
jgi:FLVCR family MFS transporter 7